MSKSIKIFLIIVFVVLGLAVFYLCFSLFKVYGEFEENELNSQYSMSGAKERIEELERNKEKIKQDSDVEVSKANNRVEELEQQLRDLKESSETAANEANQKIQNLEGKVTELENASNKVVIARTIYANIKQITQGDNEQIHLHVEGLSVNDSKGKGVFDVIVDNNTQLVKNESTSILIGDLLVGQNISISYDPTMSIEGNYIKSTLKINVLE